MTNLQQKIEMTRGDTRQWAFSITDANGSAVNIASHGGFYFTGKRSLADPDASAIFQKHIVAAAATGGGFAIASATLGYGTVKLDPSDTSSLEAAIVQLSYDLQYVDVSGSKYTVAAGKLTVRPDVTQS